MAAAAAAATIRCCRTFQLSSTKRSSCYCSSCCYCCSVGGGLRLLHPRQVQRERERVRPRRFLVASSTTNTFKFASRSSRARGLHSIVSYSLDASPNCSQQEDDGESPPEGPVSLTGGIVALGKFDALHIGHRELAMQASKAGIPFLLSLVGMAEVLGWEMRAPIVAKCDRKRVLSSWAPYCGSVAPAEFDLEFSSIRHLSPKQFVEKLAKELGVRGVVAGENYRFGYKAAGDATELVKLCKEYGMEAYIVNSVMDKKQQEEEELVLLDSSSKEKGQVSSTRVRHALSHGDIKYVSELLGRNHRLVLDRDDGFNNRRIMSAPKSCLLNLAPKEGLYDKCHCLIGDTSSPCTVIIDATHIHIHVEPNHQQVFQHNNSSSLISIEFGC